MKNRNRLPMAAVAAVMAILVCAPRAAMAADAQTSVSGAGAVSVLATAGGSVNVISGVSAATADSLNTGTATATGVGNATGATTINGSGNTLTAATGSNTISANAAGQSNTISATGIGGVNNLTAPTNNIGTTATFATTNNIGTNAAFASTNNIGSTNAGTTLTATGGNGVLSVANTQSSLTAGATLATNGTSGTTSGANSGGLTVYNTAQTIAPNTTIRTDLSPTGILNGKTYQNKVNGNLLVDGNVYINGTLDYVSSNSANTTVVGTGGTSNLSASRGTTAGTAIVMKGSAGTQTVVDAKGKITNVVTAGAAESTAALTLTNGDGNTHGLVVTETQTTMSGGRNSTSMTLHDDGATFANTSNGEAVRVHGVDDGTAPTDAVNTRQLGAGLAMVAGLAALPQVEPGKKFSIGLGTGGYMSQVSLAGGVSARIKDNITVKAGGAFVPGYTGKSQVVWNAGVQYSF